MKRAPIQLNRRFVELKESVRDESAERDLAALGLMTSVSWEQVLKHRCVVVLGEAGTGIGQGSSALRANGHNERIRHR